MATIPGLGSAVPVTEMAAVFTGILDALPDLVDRYPDARVVRNQVGNLAVLTPTDDGWEAVGWVDVLGGDGIVIHEGEDAAG